jgi:hypothetical protein
VVPCGTGPDPSHGIVEVTSSGLSHSLIDELPTPIFYLYGYMLPSFFTSGHRYYDKNFGTLTIDWEKKTARVVVHFDDGSEAFSRVVNFGKGKRD